jgi:hypothetical protein
MAGLKSRPFKAWMALPQASYAGPTRPQVRVRIGAPGMVAVDAGRLG